MNAPDLQKQNALVSTIRSIPANGLSRVRWYSDDPESGLRFNSRVIEPICTARFDKDVVSYSRGINQMSEVLRCEPTIDAVRAACQSYRDQHGDDWIDVCFSGIPNVADPRVITRSFDDGSETGIVHVEDVAEALIARSCSKPKNVEEAFGLFSSDLKQAFIEVLDNPTIVGFKTAIAHRTGLAILPHPRQQRALKEFRSIYTEVQNTPGARQKLKHKSLIEYVLHLLADLIEGRQSAEGSRLPKPIQFEMGLDEKNMTREISCSPFKLEKFIKKYSTVRMVILHAGYPFVRETGMVSKYPNVYVDLGYIFPIISRDGQEIAVRQILESCEITKIMWCSDRDWEPVWSIVADMQMRATFETVLGEYIQRGDLDLEQAKLCIENVLSHTPRKAYGMRISLLSPPTTLAPPSETSLSQCRSDKLETMLNMDQSIQYIRLCWFDFSGWMRVRIIPRHRAMALLQSKEGFKLSISKAALGVLPNDSSIKSVGPAGEYDLIPDCSTLRPSPKEGHILVMGYFREKEGLPVAVCPRTQFRRVLDLAAGHDHTFMLGFEIEFVLMRRTGSRTFEPLDTDAHQWCSMAGADYNLLAMTMIEEAVTHLAKADIHVETIHPESALGQYEIVLPAMLAHEAVDALLYARHILSTCANKQGLKMTLHPKPFAESAGTAAHVHMSILSPGDSDQAVYEPFYAGILKHLRSIAAYTCSSMVSYDRVVDGYWAGGTWVTWGTQNRETPLRKIEDSHWELKCMDGMANPYLAMSAIIAAGMSGVKDKQEMQWKECVDDPASLSQMQREQLGISEQMPLTLEEALGALKQDEKLRQLLGEEVVQRYLDVKEGEIEMLRPMDKDTLRRWVIERY